MMRSPLLIATLALLVTAGAAPLQPKSQDARDVRRVPDRRERPVVIFPADELWTPFDQQADEKVQTRSFVAGSPSGEPGMDFATVSILRGLWDAHLESAQHLFGRRLSADCPELKARLWMADSSALQRRLIHWSCPGADPPFAALQLLVQGRDDLFSVELYSRVGIPAEGVMVRWAEWLKEIRICDRGKAPPPCPPGNWDE